jgi:hypothetical protein
LPLFRADACAAAPSSPISFAAVASTHGQCSGEAQRVGLPRKQWASDRDEWRGWSVLTTQVYDPQPAIASFQCRSKRDHACVADLVVEQVQFPEFCLTCAARCGQSSQPAIADLVVAETTAGQLASTGTNRSRQCYLPRTIHMA